MLFVIPVKCYHSSWALSEVSSGLTLSPEMVERPGAPGHGDLGQSRPALLLLTVSCQAKYSVQRLC